MDKDIQKNLSGFEQVWRRVTERKAPAAQAPKNSATPVLMPQKGRRATRRFDPH